MERSPFNFVWDGVNFFHKQTVGVVGMLFIEDAWYLCSPAIDTAPVIVQRGSGGSIC